MQPNAKPLPLTAGASAILSLICTVAREERASEKDPHGAKWCRKRFIGRMRQRVSGLPAEQVVPMIGAEMLCGRRAAAGFFADHCKSCALCELGRE